MADFGGSLVASGVNTIIGYGLEATFNSAEAEDWTGMVDEIIVGRQDVVYQHRGITNKRSPTSLQTIATQYPITLRGKVDSGWQFLMGGGYCSATTDPTISLFRGTAHMANSPTKTYLPSWTVKRTFDDDAVNLSFTGTTFNTATFKCDLNSPWTYDISGVAKAQGTTAATGVAIPSKMFGSWNTTVSVDVDDADYDAGLAISGLRSVAFTINQNLQVRNEYGTSNPVGIRQPKAGLGDVSLSLSRGYVDDDLWTQLADGGYNSFQIVTTDGTDTYTLVFNDCRSEPTTSTTNTDGETMEDITFVVKDWTCTVADSVTYVAWK